MALGVAAEFLPLRSALSRRKCLGRRVEPSAIDVDAIVPGRGAKKREKRPTVRRIASLYFQVLCDRDCRRRGWRVDSAQRLIAQAAGTSGKKKAKRLMRKGIKALKQAAGIAAKAAKKGTISSGCAASIAKQFGNVRAAADSWLRTRSKCITVVTGKPLAWILLRGLPALLHAVVIPLPHPRPSAILVVVR